MRRQAYIRHPGLLGEIGGVAQPPEFLLSSRDQVAPGSAGR